MLHTITQNTLSLRVSILSALAGLLAVLLGGFIVPDLALAASQGQVVINEVLPIGTEERVELRNTTEIDIDISGWYLTHLENPDTETPSRANLPSLSGNLPAGGVLLFSVSNLNDLKGDSVDLYDGDPLAGGNLIHRLTYGDFLGTTTLNISSDIGLPESGESIYLASANPDVWATTTTSTLGWINGSPTLAELGDAILGDGLLNNATTTGNPSASTDFYLEATNGNGKIAWSGTVLNLSSAENREFLENLNGKTTFDAGRVGIDASTATDFQNATATVSMYGLDALGFGAQPTLRVYDSDGVLIPASSPEYPYIENESWDGSRFSFNVGHLSLFEAVSEVYVDDSNVSGIELGTEAHPFLTIQEGLAAVAPGGTVHVAEGVYTEQLVLDKAGVQLVGDGKDLVTVQPTTVPSAGVPDVAINASNTRIEGITFDFNGSDEARSGLGIFISDLDGPDVNDATLTELRIYGGDGDSSVTGAGTSIQTGKNADVGGLLIDGVIFIGDDDNSSEGVFVNPHTGVDVVTVQNSTFEGHLFRGIAVESDNVVVLNNSIEDTVSIGVSAGIAILDFVGGVSYDNIIISGNTVVNMTRGLDIGTTADLGSSLNVDASQNTYRDNTVGVRIRYGANGVIATSTINSNSTEVLVIANAGNVLFSGNDFAGESNTDDTIAVQNDDAGTLNALNNWWGTVNGPTHAGNNPDGTGRGVSDNVNFRPWCSTQSCDSLDSTAPTVVSALTSPNPTKAGLITVAVTFSETMNTTVAPTVSVLGLVDSPLTLAQDSYSGTSWVGTTTIADNSEYKTASTTVFGGQDLSGNVMVADLEAGTFVVDTVRPTITSITSDATGAGTLKIGDTIVFTLTPESSETGASIEGSAYNGNALSWITGDGGVTFVATTTIIENDTSSTTPLQLTGVVLTDAVGNDSVPVDGEDVAKDIDAIRPTLSDVSLISSNASTTLARVGDTLFVTGIASEAGTPLVIFPGVTHAVPDSVGGDPIDFDRFVVIDDATEGQITFELTFTDEAGNTTSATTTLTTDGSSVRFDKTPPTVVSVTSDTPNGTYKPGDVITLRLTFSELASTTGTAIMTLENGATCNFGAATILSTTCPYTVIVREGEDTAELENFSIAATIADAAGNLMTDFAPAQNLAASTDIVIDTTAPVIDSITADATTGALRKIGDVITFTLTPTTTEDEATVAGAYNGRALEWATADDGVTYTATYTITEGDPDQATALQITGVTITDTVGNVSDPKDGEDITDRIDATRPTLPSVSIASSNTATTTRAKEGDTVTLAITASESLASTTVFLLGREADIVGTSGSWTASTTVRAEDAEGAVPMLVLFEDVAGNTGTSTVATTDSSSVAIDLTVPTITSVSLSSPDNASTTLSKVGDDVVLTFTASEALLTPTVFLAGRDIAPQTADDGVTWSATTELGEGDAEGSVDFTITFADAVGNDGVLVSDTLDGTAVRFDKTAPTITASSIVSDNSASTTLAKGGDVITFALTASEEIETPTLTVLSRSLVPTSSDNLTWSASTTVLAGDTEGDVAYSFTVADYAGNVTGPTVTVTDDTNVSVDLTAPAFDSITTTGASGKFGLGEAFPLTLSFSEQVTIEGGTLALNSGAGLSLDVSADDSASLTYTTGAGEDASPLDVTVLTGTMTDAAGNVATDAVPTTNLSSAKTIEVDTTAPAAISDLDGVSDLSRVRLFWTAPAASDSTVYDLRFSREPITTDNFSEAIETDDEPTVAPSTNQSYQKGGLLPTTVYYFALRSRDDVFNWSPIAFFATSTTDTVSEAFIPASVTSFAPTTLAQNASTTMTITGSDFVDDVNTVRLVSGDNVVHLDAVFVSDSSLMVGIPAGLPAGIYSVAVLNAAGISSALSGFSVSAIASFPSVTHILPIVVGTGSSQVIDIYGENLSGAIAAALSDGTLLTGLAFVDDTHLTANMPGGVTEGEYYVRITTPIGTNEASAVVLSVEAPVVVNAQTRIETNKVISLSGGTSTLPETVITNDGAKEPTADGALVEVEIDAGTTVSSGGSAYTGDILPPRIVKADLVQAGNLLDDAVILEMGSTAGTLDMSQDFVAKITVTGRLAPTILFWDGTGYELAGKAGEKGGTTYAPGGVVLSEVTLSSDTKQFTMGVLLDHMSVYVATLPPTLDSFSPTRGIARKSSSADQITLVGSNLHGSASVTVGGVSAGVLSRSGTNSITFEIPSSLSEGTYTVTVTNPSSLSASRSLTLDRETGGGGPAQNLAPFVGGGGGGGGGIVIPSTSITPDLPSAPSTAIAPTVSAPTPSSVSIVNVPTSGVGAVFATNLTVGSRGGEVTRLQQFLSDIDVYSGPITGYFGPLTKSAVQRYQFREGIFPVAGFVGPLTRTALNSGVDTSAPNLATAPREVGEGQIAGVGAIVPDESTLVSIRSRLAELVSMVARLQTQLAALGAAETAPGTEGQ